jgi:hypothetical protein
VTDETAAPRWQLGWIGLALLGLLGVGAILVLRTTGVLLRSIGGGPTRITHAVALARMEAVGKLVTNETGLRDVVTFENTRFGSTKRSLVVVTGKALVGIDLKQHAKVDIAEAERRIRLTLPRARLIGVEITELKTYDEQSGLWNWFYPADRDTVYLLARAQLSHAATDLAVLQHAEQSARELLTTLFATDGYAVDIVFEPFLSQPAN